MREEEVRQQREEAKVVQQRGDRDAEQAAEELAATVQFLASDASSFITGQILNKRTGETIAAQPVPPFMQGILNTGGLVNYVKDRLKATA